MKVEVDFTNKVVTLQQEVSFHELLTIMERIIGDDSPSEWSIKSNQFYHTNSYYATKPSQLDPWAFESYTTYKDSDD